MIRLLTGTIHTVFTEEVIIDVHGVGYAVWVTPSAARDLQVQSGQVTSLHIYTHVKEDALQLFGFRSSSERELFVHLLSVSGIGPKTALSVLDKGAEGIAQAIRTSDVGFFSGVPRLGKKSAQKIIVELQPKLGKLQELDLSPETPVASDVREALVGMGYPESLVRDVLGQLDSSLDVAGALKWSLQELARRRS